MAALASLALLLCSACSPLTLPPVAAGQGDRVLYTDAAARVCTQPDQRVLESIVRIATGDGSDASGIVVATDRVLTAAHVVFDSGITLVRVDDQFHTARLLALDHSADLALLAVDTGALQPLPLSRRTLADYEKVWAIGYPLALEQVTTYGFFRAESQGRLFTSARIEAGTSGGGLMRCEDGHFELVGMIRGYAAYQVGEELIHLNDVSIHTPAQQIQRFVYLTDGMRL